MCKIINYTQLYNNTREMGSQIEFWVLAARFESSRENLKAEGPDRLKTGSYKGF